MKRSRSILLVLSGTLATGLITGCDREPEVRPESVGADVPDISPDNTYTNNHYVHGVGYYHAPYRAWYRFPYNYYDPARGYYAGDRWSSTPDPNVVHLSQPTQAAVSEARSRIGSGSDTSSHSTSVRRSGFGSSAHSSSAS